MPYFLRHLALQLVAILLVTTVAWPYYAVYDSPPPWGLLSLATGACAGALAWATRQPLWWRIIHPLFLPLAWMVSSLQIAPGWFLLSFITLFLIYRGALSGRIPLYLSNGQTANALLDIADQHHTCRMIDLGAGFGGVTRRFITKRPQIKAAGVENAPLTWLIGYLINRLLFHRTAHGIDWRYGTLWNIDLGEFDLVYAFLSPEPMPSLWQKAKAEMQPGALLVSNSFPVPDVEPTSIVELGDPRATILYCYTL